jgi:hypothetical protein
MIAPMRQMAALALLLLAGLGGTQAQQPPVQPGVTNAERVEHWREDLHAFAANLRGTPIPEQKNLPGQKDLAKLYPHLDADLAALEAELPNLRNGAISWRLAKILASAHIGHNSIMPGDPQAIPLQFEWLDEGLVVTGASAEFKTAIGSRVLNVGNLSPAAFLESVSPYIAYETEGWLRHIASGVMWRRALLELLNLVQDGQLRLTLEGSNGPMMLAVPFSPAQTPMISLREGLGLPIPLTDSHANERYYWRQFLTDSQTLYVQYRQCADDPKLKFSDFAAQTMAEIDSSKPRRVIVDLRFNSGGNSRVIEPLIAGLASRSKTIGAPLVLIGPGTFSSGVIAAYDLRRKAKARLAGTPTGGLLGGYGESPSRKLPNSQLGMQWTIKYFPSPEPVRPDITIVTTAADLRAGRDPVLATAIAAPR